MGARINKLGDSRFEKRNPHGAGSFHEPSETFDHTLPASGPRAGVVIVFLPALEL
jgi:hypothetical protein